MLSLLSLKATTAITKGLRIFHFKFNRNYLNNSCAEMMPIATWLVNSNLSVLKTRREKIV